MRSGAKSDKKGTGIVSVAPGGQAYTGPLDVRQSKRTRRIVCGSRYVRSAWCSRLVGRRRVDGRSTADPVNGGR